jgi:diacylglycerol O-acyltransferase
MTTRTSVPATLTAELIHRLSQLAGQPDGVAEVALSTLRFGSLALLMAHGIIEPVDLTTDLGNRIVLTPYGRRVIEASAQLRPQAEDSGESPFEMLRIASSLTSGVCDLLARLASEPPAVAEVALSAQRFGALDELVAAGVIDPVDTTSDQGGRLVVTERGWQIMQACAALAAGDHEQQPAATRSRRSGQAVSDHDAAMLEQERGSTAMQVGTVTRLGRPSPSHEDVLTYLNARIHHVPRYRQKLADPLGPVSRQRWAEDASFELNFHVRHESVEGSGPKGFDQLVARIFSTPLDRSRPLWECWFVDGLDNDEWALITKVHLVLVEDMSGPNLITTLFDLAPDSEFDTGPSAAASEPSSLGMAVWTLGEALVGTLTTPLRLLTKVSGPRETLSRLGRLRDEIRAAPDVPHLNHPSGEHRAVAFRDIPAADVSKIRSAADASGRELLLGATTNAMRQWLRRSGGLHSEDVHPVAALLTVGGSGDESLAAHITHRLVHLPISKADPVEQLRSIQRAYREPVEDRDILATLARYTPRTVLGQLARLGLFARHYNLMLAYIAGPRLPLFVLGRRVLSMHPVGFLTERHALAIWAMSYDDNLQLGVIADRDSVPNLDALADDLVSAIRDLHRASAEQKQEPVHQPA